MEMPPPLPPPTNPPLATTKPDSNDKLLIILCHLSVFLGVGLILPLIIYLIKKGESEDVTAHARETLNFHISLLLYGIGSFVLVFVLIGIPMLFALVVVGIVFPIIGAVKASEGILYRYPLTIRLV
jgi:uncharacterized Tic20 family protein